MGFPLHQGTVEAGLADMPLAPRSLRPRCRAARSTLGPTTRRASMSSSTVTTSSSTPVPRVIRVEHLRRRLRDGLEQGLTLVIAKAVLGLLEASVSTERDRAHGHRVRLHATAPTGGVRGSRCSSRWRTCSTGSPPTTRRSRSCTGSRSSAVTHAGQPPRFSDAAFDATDALDIDRLVGLVPAVRRDACGRRGRARARDRDRRRGHRSPRSRP